MKKFILVLLVVLFTATSSFAAIKLRRDTAANWTTNDPTLASGEVAIETDTKRVKIGDAASAWTALPYASSPPAVIEVNGSSSNTLTAEEVSSTIVYNTGMGAADVALVLPTAAAGYSAIFTVGTAQPNKWGVQAGTNDKIYLLAADGTIATGSDNGYARMTAAQVGQSFACWTIKTDAYDWQCKAISVGTSTFAAN